MIFRPFDHHYVSGVIGSFALFPVSLRKGWRCQRVVYLFGHCWTLAARPLTRVVCDSPAVSLSRESASKVIDLRRILATLVYL
jgi:hypothetical protein